MKENIVRGHTTFVAEEARSRGGNFLVFVEAPHASVSVDCYPKICEHGCHSVAQKNICWYDVSVDHTMFVLVPQWRSLCIIFRSAETARPPAWLDAGEKERVARARQT
jgi:hypothetical protein